MATEINGSSANVKLSRHGDGSYSAWGGRFKIRKVESELDSDYYYTIDDADTGNLLRGPSRRLDDVKETIERFLLKESREQREAADKAAEAQPQPKYPECEKVAAVRDKSQTIGNFLEWLHHEKGVVFRKHVEGEFHAQPFNYNIQRLLAEFFDIDLDKFHQEQNQMLAEIRQQHKEQ